MLHKQNMYFFHYLKIFQFLSIKKRIIIKLLKLLTN